MTPSRASVPVLLISGAGLPAWIWDATRRTIGDTHETHVAARPSQGEEARLRDYVDAALRSAPSGPFAVVAHSAGGLVGLELARLHPDRVTALLAVSAVVPEPGGSFVSAMPVPQRWVLSLALRFAGTRPPDAAVRRGLAGGLDAVTTERIVADLVTESPALYRDLTTKGAWSGPRGYVSTTQDRELSASLQRTFAGRLGGSWADELATGHLPMLEQPDALAQTIRRFLAAHP